MKNSRVSGAIDECTLIAGPIVTILTKIWYGDAADPFVCGQRTGG
jgi:hypothetical protein